MLDLFAKAIAENNQKDMLRWGPHVRTFRDEMMTKLENQFHWLEPEKADHPRYEEQFQPVNVVLLHVLGTFPRVLHGLKQELHLLVHIADEPQVVLNLLHMVQIGQMALLGRVGPCRGLRERLGGYLPPNRDHRHVLALSSRSHARVYCDRFFSNSRNRSSYRG